MFTLCLDSYEFSRIWYMYLILNWPSLLKAAFFLLANTARKRKFKLNILKLKFVCVIPVSCQKYYMIFTLFIFSL
jgi:hypothetical protein